MALESLVGNVREDCLAHFWRKFLIFWLVFLVAWNLTKVPFYVAFDSKGDSLYEKGGLTGSINLIYWLDGFDSSKLHSPACNFLLVHIAFGSQVLIMMALTMVKTAWRKKYGYYFFTFAVLLAAHTLPAAWRMSAAFTKYLFTLTCVIVLIASAWGYDTMMNYEKLGTAKAEKNLAWQYGIVTFCAYGAGFAESFGIATKFLYHAEHGEWKQYGHEPHPYWGNMIYDKFPEWQGMWFFWIFVFVFWIWWPIKLVAIDTSPPGSGYQTIPSAS